MAKNQKSNDLEREAMVSLGEDVAVVAAPEAEADADLTKEFNIHPGQPLPEDFENPKCGEHKHLCVDPAGRYRPDWFQLKIHSAFPNQANPQKFMLGTIYSVALDTWTDVPPAIIESLKSAEETHHEMYAEAPQPKPGEVILGNKAVHKAITRPRFMYTFMSSCRV